MKSKRIAGAISTPVCHAGGHGSPNLQVGPAARSLLQCQPENGRGPPQDDRWLRERARSERLDRTDQADVLRDRPTVSPTVQAIAPSRRRSPGKVSYHRLHRQPTRDSLPTSAKPSPTSLRQPQGGRWSRTVWTASTGAVVWTVVGRHPTSPNQVPPRFRRQVVVDRFWEYRRDSGGERSWRGLVGRRSGCL